LPSRLISSSSPRTVAITSSSGPKSSFAIISSSETPERRTCAGRCG
jgi:hypothetical protein